VEERGFSRALRSEIPWGFSPGEWNKDREEREAIPVNRFIDRGEPTWLDTKMQYAAFAVAKA
jgi:hypothetical protein